MDTNSQNTCSGNAAWMAGKVGAFMHYLPRTPDNMDTAAAGFDVAGVVRQLVEMRVDWFCLTLGQNDGYFIAPNDTYEALAEYPRASHCLARDIPAEFIEALRPHGIRFMLYLTCQTPTRDPEAISKFGFGEDVRRGDRRLTAEGVAKWARVIAEWSRRYGDGVSGWWFDGAYDYLGFGADVARIYTEAVKTGNPRAVAAYNSGLDVPPQPGLGDFSAGELDLPFEHDCHSLFAGKGMQWHVLTYLGDYWMKTNRRYEDGQWRPWLADVLSRGGAVTLDMGHDFPSGLFDAAQAAQFRRITEQ